MVCAKNYGCADLIQTNNVHICTCNAYGNEKKVVWHLTGNGDGHHVLNDMRLKDLIVCSVYISICLI